jgi:ABC-2 type transport system permease protein
MRRRLLRSHGAGTALSAIREIPITGAEASNEPRNRVAPAYAVLRQLLFLPLALAPTLLPFGTEFLLGLYGWGEGVPICLALSIVECAAIVYLYRAILTWEGGLLQMREQKILEAVVTKDE